MALISSKVYDSSSCDCVSRVGATRIGARHSGHAGAALREIISARHRLHARCSGCRPEMAGWSRTGRRVVLLYAS